MRRVAESLAGRASYLTLWPMTRRELRGLGRCGIWEELLATPEAEWRDVVAAQPGEPDDWRELARRGGFRCRPCAWRPPQIRWRRLQGHPKIALSVTARRLFCLLPT